MKEAPKQYAGPFKGSELADLISRGYMPVMR